MEQSESVNELAAALALAQGEMMSAARTQINPAFRSSYADLASVWDACRMPLSKNGLAVVQTTEGMVDGNITITTTLLHSSGQWLRGCLTVPVRGRSVTQGRAEPDAQAIGSAITYARRYALAAMVGIAPEDDDGAAASTKDTGGETPYKAPATKPPARGGPTMPPPPKQSPSPMVEAAVVMGAEVESLGDDMAAWANEHRTQDQADEIRKLLGEHGLSEGWLRQNGFPFSREKPMTRLAAFNALQQLSQLPVDISAK